MKIIYIFIPFLMLSLSAQSQSEIVGAWKLSPLKILTLKSDNTFLLKKGAYLHEGEYSVQKKSNYSILIMRFETKRIDYEILYSDPTNLQLKDILNDKILNATLIKTKNSKKDKKSEIRTTIKEVPSGSYQLNKPASSLNSDSKFLLTLYGGGRLNQLNHKELVDTTIVMTDSEMKIKYNRIAGFSGGIKIGYQILDEMIYAGSGFGIASNGFRTTQSLITKNSVYQYDSEITQSAKYTMYGLQIPFWVSTSPLKSGKLSVELGSFLGIPLKQTSKTEFENSEIYTVNGSYNDELSRINKEPYVNEYPDIVQNVTLGLSFEIRYYPTRRLGVGFEYQSNRDYMTFDSKKITNRSLGLNLQLRLF